MIVMEPVTITMYRELTQYNNEPIKERHPGDGMESYTLDDHIKLSTSSYKSVKTSHRKLISPTSNKSINKIVNKNDSLNLSDTSITSFTSPEQSSDDINNFERQDKYFGKSNQDFLITVDSLRTQLKLFEDHNNQLIEEKMRLSQQLGVQTQVNNELKRLLVASIGEDLEHKYERLIQDKSQTDLELKHLHNTLQEDREEVEQAMIQADVWRSKFLASRVMSGELARWRSALHYKHRESHAALQSLLEEHSKIRALNNATRRGLITVAELHDCKDPSLDSEIHLTTVDVAFMNHDLVEALIEVIQENKETQLHTKETKMIEIRGTVMKKEKGKNNLMNDFYIEANELTPAEQLAHEVVLNTGIQTEELTRMRRDYLAHNRISHFLSTNYYVTYNCCEKCSGQVHVV